MPKESSCQFLELTIPPEGPQDNSRSWARRRTGQEDDARSVQRPRDEDSEEVGQGLVCYLESDRGVDDRAVKHGEPLDGRGGQATGGEGGAEEGSERRGGQTECVVRVVEQ